MTLTDTALDETHLISSFTSWSDTEIRFVLPTITNVASPGWNAQFTAGISSTSIGFFPFVDGSGYNITAISPSPATAGQTITMTGTFPATQGTGFGFNLQTGKGVSIAPLSWSATTITFVLQTNVAGGFPPGLVQIIELWANGHFPLVPPGLHAPILLNVEANPFIETTIPSPATVAPSQSFELVGTFFGYAQGSTTCTFNTVGGLGVPITPTSWGTATSGTYNGSQVITFTLPSGADLSSSSSIVFTNGLYSATAHLTVEAALVLPGGTSGTRYQPVELAGSGFGATFGTLTYFSQNGAPVAATPTDWSNTIIRANIPGSADFAPGFIWVFPTGTSREAGIFTGFTIGSHASGPASTLFPNGALVTSMNTTGTYPIPQGSTFPRGVVQNPAAGVNTYLVAWLNANGTYSNITTPSSDMVPLGGLAVQSQTVLGTFPPVVGGGG